MQFLIHSLEWNSSTSNRLLSDASIAGAQHILHRKAYFE